MSPVALRESPRFSAIEGECPLTVKQAAKFLGVSPQTVYLWVERKQIPHLRVMGRNIRFLRSDLEPFRASFRQEMVNVYPTKARRSCLFAERRQGSVDPLPRPERQTLPGIHRNRRLARSQSQAAGTA